MNIVITQSLSGITPANRNRCGPNLVCQRVTTFRKFWRDCPTRVKLGSTELGRVPRSRFFLSPIPDDFSATADMYQIYPQHVSPCPIKTYRKGFSKNFRLGVICPPKPQN